MELTERELEIIRKALSYMASNVSDVNECFEDEENFEVFETLEVFNLLEKLCPEE